MRILPINNYTIKPHQISKLHNKNVSDSISFCGIKSKYNLINSGYKVLNIDNFEQNSNKIIIDSAQKLVALSNSPAMWNKKFVLSNDIDLSNVENYKPIGTKDRPFTGEFDGNDCIISGLNINKPDSNYCGLFGVCKSAKLKNFDIRRAVITSKAQSGILAGSVDKSNIENCKINQSYIEGSTKIGGLIGLSSNNSFQNISVRAQVNGSKNSSGGILGYDELSTLDSCFSDSTVKAKEEAGGLIGYSNETTINNSYSLGRQISNEKTGGLIGWGDASIISGSYAKDSSSLVGYDDDCRLNGCIDDINKSSDWIYLLNDDLWDIDRYSQYKSLPRLKSIVKTELPEKIFLEDLNYNISTKCFDLKPEPYKTFEKPKHYDDNNDYLATARNCHDTGKLQSLFGDLALELYYDFENKKYDEVFLEIVKNPAFRPNKIYNILYYNDNYSCTPIFILTTLNRPYILREALKRDDLGDIEKLNGWWLTGKKTVMDRAIDHNLLDCVYVMLNAKNQKFDIEKYKEKAKCSSPEMAALFSSYPNIPDYEAFKSEGRTVSNIDNLKDVLTSVDIPKDFKDSQGNSILNIAAMLEDEQLGLQIALNAIHRDFDINHTNKKGDSPLKIALDYKKPSIAYNLIKYGADINITNNDGENAILAFSTLDNEIIANNFVDFCIEKGISQNSQDLKGNTALINSINSQKYEIAENLLQKGASPSLPDFEGQTPLHIACYYQDKKAVLMLLENFANVFALNETGKSPKEYLTDESLIAEYEKYEKMYNENNINTDNEIYSGEDAANKTTRKLIDELRETQDEFNEHKDEEGNNFLHIACNNKTDFGKEFIKLALDKGININSQNSEGKTPLMIAIDTYNECDSNKEKLNVLANIKYLLENNPNIEKTDKNKQSALHCACKTDNSIILNLILSKDPKINVKDCNGNTPMSYIESDVVKSAMDNYVQKIMKGL